MALQDPKVNLFNIVRNYFNWCFENPDKIKPAHTAIYFYALDMNNRFGWKEKFSFPSLQAMEATSIKSKNTFYKAFNELAEFGFIKIIATSKNQNTANIISISAVIEFESAQYTVNTSALDLANIQHEFGGGNKDKQINKKPTKQEKNENSIAFDLIKLEKPEDLNIFNNEHRTLVNNWDELIKSFNIQMELEIAQKTIKSKSQELFPRFKKYTNWWILNQSKYVKVPALVSTAPRRITNGH